MAKRQVSTSVEDPLYERIQLLMKIDKRSQAQILAWAVERGLPLVEEEFRKRLESRALKSPEGKHQKKVA